MDENVPPNLIIDVVLKGGPPWGFRIKEKHNTVIISKINCGGRASKIGLRQNDEIIAVNNLEIDKHPLTLDIESKDDDLQLTKLDFTYQLIKHTINHTLHLKVKRTNLGEQSQSCCYPHTDDEDEQKAEDDSKLSNERRRSELHEFGSSLNGTCIHQQAAQSIQANGTLKAANQLHHPFAEYCLNKTNEELVLSSGDEFAASIQRQRPANYPQFILNQQLNGAIGVNGTARFHTNLKDPQTLNGFHQTNVHHHHLPQPAAAQTQTTECTYMHPNHTLFAAAAQPANQFNQPKIICTPTPDQPTVATTIVQQPLQLLIDDQSDLHTTDINMDSSPCSESASDLNLKQFSSRSHKDVWSPGSTTTSTGSNSSCDMHSDSTIKDPVILQTDQTLANILPSSNLANVNNLSLNNIGEMNMVLGLGRLDLSNIQQMQQANQMNQLSQQMNQQIGQQMGQQMSSNLQSNVQLTSQPDTNLLVQQQLMPQTANQPTQLQSTLPGYFLPSNITPIASNIRPIVIDHNNNAVDLSSLNQFNQRTATEQMLTNELTNRIVSPSTQSEASTNTQISKKIGIRVGSPPPNGQFKCWTLPRYVQQPFTQQQTSAAQRYTPQYVMSYNEQLPSSDHPFMSTRKQLDAQQFASQILYTKQNRMDAELDSPQSNSQPDLLQPDHSITPTPHQQPLNYYPLHMHLEQAGLPDSYAKFCYETATHKYYTIPASVAQRGSVLSLVAPPPSRYSDRSIKRRKQQRRQLKMSKSLSKRNSDESSGESESELLDVNDGDDEIDLKMLRDESDDDKDVSSDEDADNEEIERVECSEQEIVKSTNQPQSSKTFGDKQPRKDSQKASDLNASSEQAMEDGRPIETNLDEGDEKSRTDKDNKRKKLSSQFVSSKKSKKSIKKSTKKRPSSKSETKFEMSASELLKTKLRQVKKKFELVNLLNDEEKKHTGKIADYLPGRSSVLVREKQKESLSDYENINDRRTAMSMGKLEDTHHLSKAKEQQRRKRQQQLRKLQRHHQHSILSKNCAFNVLISDDTTTTNGYESDSSYIVRKREPIPAPISRSVYSSVQRGEDIPFEGLRRSMPYLRTKDDKFKKQSTADARDTDQLNRYIDKELDWINHETSLMSQRRHHYNISPQHQILSLNRYKYAAANKSTSELSKSLLAKVLYDFRAAYGRELSVKKGDIVIVIRSVNNNWVEVEDIESGLKGLVPRNFLDYEQEGLAKAKYDFDAKTGVEVSFKKDEILRLIRKVDLNWFEGLNSKNERGIIPINYIEVMRLPLNLHFDNQFLNIICKGQSTTPQSHLYTRSVASTPQSSYFSSNIRAKQVGSHPNLSIEPIIESDSANSSNNHQPTQPPNASFFYSRSSSAMCQNKTLAAQQKSSIEHFSQKASLAASAPHLIDDAEQTVVKPLKINQSTTTTDQSQQITAAQSTNQNSQQNAPLHPPLPLPLQSDFASTTSIATSSNTISQLPVDANYALRNQLYNNQQYLFHPRNHHNINNHLNLNKRPPPPNNATNNSRLALKRLYRVMYPYEPLQADELRLIAGDIVSVSMHCDDGWYIGFSSLTGLSGTFPGNYCRPLH